MKARHVMHGGNGALNVSVRNRDFRSEEPCNYVNSDVITRIVSSQEKGFGVVRNGERGSRV